VKGRVVDDEIVIGRRDHRLEIGCGGVVNRNGELHRRGTLKRPAGLEGQRRGFVPQAAVRVAPGVEHAAGGAEREGP
jgi:hypothetical protein